MELTELNAMTYLGRCGSCGQLSPYTMFQSSFYGFRSYFGETTKTLYRLDINSTDEMYGKISADDALKPAIDREGGREHLHLIPDELKCSKCLKAAISMAKDLGSGFGERVQAIMLPNKSP